MSSTVRKRASSDVLNVEKEGVLQKWSKNIRRWQPRFVNTTRSSLSYYKYNGAPPPPNAVPDFYLDLKDVIKVIRSPEALTFDLLNAKGESVVKLKSNGQRDYESWVDVLEKKVAFLVRNKDTEEDGDFAITLVTNTFTMLQLMDDTEATEFANESLNEIYAEAMEGPHGRGLEGTLQGTDRVLHVVEELCEDFQTELRAVEGKPEERKAFLLCERLFRRYYSAIRTRLLLEVSSVLGMHITADDMAKEPLSVIIQVINFLEERLKPVLLKEEITGLKGPEREGVGAYLCPPETFTAAIVSQSISAVDIAWRKEVKRLEAKIQSGGVGISSNNFISSYLETNTRYAEQPPRLTIIFETMGEIFDRLSSMKDTQQADFLRKKIFTSCILFVSGNFQAISIKEAIPNLTLEDEKYIARMLKDLDQCPVHLKHLTTQWSTSVIVPEIKDVFLSGAHKLMKEIVSLFVHRFLETDESLSKMVNLLFNSPLWTAGEVTPTVINKFKLFLTIKQEELPPGLHETLEKRLLRGFLVRYLRQFLRIPSPLQISDEGIFRVVDDETRVKEWVEFNRWSCRQERLDQLWPLRWVRIFLLMPAIPSEILSLYNEALQQANPKVALPLYDLLRYCLKLRTDVPSQARKAGLAACHECIKQVTARSVSPPPVNAYTDILLDLFPQAGQVHITGKPWKFEEPEETDDVFVSVASLVVETTAKQAKARAAKTKESSATVLGPGEASEMLVTFPVQEKVGPPSAGSSPVKASVVDPSIAAAVANPFSDEEGEEEEEEKQEGGEPVRSETPTGPIESPGSPVDESSPDDDGGGHGLASASAPAPYREEKEGKIAAESPPPEIIIKSAPPAPPVTPLEDTVPHATSRQPSATALLDLSPQESQSTATTIQSPSKSSFLSFGRNKKIMGRSVSLATEDSSKAAGKPRRNSLSLLSQKNASFRFLGSKGQGGSKSMDVRGEGRDEGLDDSSSPTTHQDGEGSPFGDDSPSTPPVPVPSPPITAPVAEPPVQTTITSTPPPSPPQVTPEPANPFEDEPANPFEDDDDGEVTTRPSPPPPPGPANKPSPSRSPRERAGPVSSRQPHAVPAQAKRRVFGGRWEEEDSSPAPPPPSSAQPRGPAHPPRQKAASPGSRRQQAASPNGHSSNSAAPRRQGGGEGRGRGGAQRRSFGGTGAGRGSGDWW